MLKKIFVCVALITCCTCFAGGFNFETLKNPPSNILHVKTDSGSLIWMSKKYYSVKLPQYNCMVFFLSRIIQKDGKPSCQVIFSNNREPISELFIKFKNGKTIPICKLKSDIVQEDDNQNYYRFVGELSVQEYIDCFVKKMPATILFKMPKTSTDSKLEILMDKNWINSFNDMKPFFKLDNEVQVQFR